LDRLAGSRQTIPPRAVRPEQLSDSLRQRYQDRAERGDAFRNAWRDLRGQYPNDLFEASWRNRYGDLARGYYNYGYGYGYPYYWWTGSNWGDTASWVYGGYSQPYDYDYGGTVVYQGNTVYVGGQEAGSSTQYAEQAMAIADSGAKQLAAAEAQPQSAQKQWLPLGVFAITNEQAAAPTLFLQLAVSKEGLIAGTYYNAVTNQALAVQGGVDRATQRASWYAGDNRDVVMEAGIYNLTEDQTPALVHFGTGQQQVLLVRLPQPQQPAEQPAREG
jgi:hypothetical protein